MGNFISNFQTTAELATFSATTDFKMPHVSLTKDDKQVHFFDQYNGHAYVEIGGLKWATMNVGASNVSDAGLYFQWADNQGYTADQVGDGEGQKLFDTYYWSDYKYGNPNEGGFTKYDGTDFTVLQPSDDAAQAYWGGAWRMPTTEEFQALGAAVTTAWTQVNGVYGMLCTDKTDSSKTLFFPAAGGCGDGSVDLVGSSGRYWSSSLLSSNVSNARLLYFNSGIVNWDYNSLNRSHGCTVRGVVG